MIHSTAKVVINVTFCSRVFYWYFSQRFTALSFKEEENSCGFINESRYKLHHQGASARLLAGGLHPELSQTAPPRGANSWCDVPVTAWRTSCLYGVSHSRTSPTYPDGVTSLVSGKTAPSTTFLDNVVFLLTLLYI